MKKNRILSFDLLRIIAIIGVIAIHVSYPPLYNLTTDPFAWWISNIVESLLRWVVPIFFMISGLFLLNKNESTKDMINKRIVTILLPFNFWIIVYSVLDILYNKDHTFLNIYIKSLKGPYIFHFWFVYILIGLYFITPILRVFVKNSNKKTLEYFLYLCFIFSSIVPLVDKYLHFRLGVNIPLVEGYIGYFVLGYYLNAYPLSARTRKYTYFLTYLSWLFIILGTYTLTISSGKYDDFYHQYLTVPVVFTSIGVFCYFQNLDKINENRAFSILCKKLNVSRVCFGIYLSHIVILSLLKNGKLGIRLDVTTINPFIGIFLTTFSCFCICLVPFCFLELSKKNKFVNMISRIIN